MIELSEEQRQTLDRSPDVPPRVLDPVTGRIEVLLRADDFAWVRDLLKDEPAAPLLMDSRTGMQYALLPEERYERFNAFFEEDPLTAAEKMALLREAGKRARWNEAIWN